MAAEEELRFPIGIPVDTNAGDAANEVESLRDRITASKLSLQAMNGSLRNITSKTAEATAAKKVLKDAIAAERQAVEAATLKLVKMGTTYDAQAARAKQRAKEEAEHAKGLGKALGAVGGPVGTLHARLTGLRDMLKSTGGGMNLVALAGAGLVAAIAAVTVALGAGAIALGRWILRGADAARSMALVREAAGIGAENARALGTQVTALANKVPTTTERLNEMAAALARGGLSGTTLVDTMNAVEQASAANGDAAGAKLREIVERGKLTQRMFLGLRELAGTGLDFDDVAASLAKATGKGIQEARKALLSGRVTLASGAEALRRAAEAKFGEINLRKMLSFDGLAETLRKRLGALTADVKIEPLLRGLSSILDMFAETSATGAVLKRTVTAIGNGLAVSIEKAAPLAKQFIRGLIIGGLQLYITYLQLKKTLGSTFGQSSVFAKIDWMNAALTAGKVAVTTLAVGVVMLGATLAAAAAPFVFVVEQLGALASGASDAYDTIRSLDWTGTGSAIVTGLVAGLVGGATRLGDAVKSLATKIKTGFADALQIRSPSRVFREYGANTVEGFEQGVDGGADDANAALAKAAAPPAKASSSAGAAAGGASLPPIHVTIHAPGATAEAVEAMRAKDFLEEITAAVLRACASGGVLVPG